MKNNNNQKLVLLAMSGGVDSSVALAKLLNDGFKVIGITLKLWDHEYDDSNLIKESQCNTIDAVNGAKLVCNQFDVHHYTLNFKDLFKKYVVDDFIDEYSNGRTPNPCVKCNAFVKWDGLMQQADKLGAQYIATGHYAIIDNQTDTIKLKKGKDPTKDQSYMLWKVRREYLNRTLFPLGNMTKEEVRAYAEKENLVTAKRPESMDLCFIDTNNYGKFLNNYIPNKFKNIKEGIILNESGDNIGSHKGFYNYTIGQRKGLGLSRTEPRYVQNINPKNNQIVVSKKENLYSTECTLIDYNWIIDKPKMPMEADVKIRYYSKSSKATISYQKKELKVNFKDPQFAITKGQSAVFYNKNQLLGGGVIK